MEFPAPIAVLVQARKQSRAEWPCRAYASESVVEEEDSIPNNLGIVVDFLHCFIGRTGFNWHFYSGGRSVQIQREIHRTGEVIFR